MKLTESLRVTGIALVLTAAATGLAMAQSDVLGVTPVSQDAITVMKAVGLAAIGWGFLRLMGGRHTVEGLTMIGIGGLGLAKSSAIASLFGF
jgi:uncharacterized protein (UPF0261 family)